MSEDSRTVKIESKREFLNPLESYDVGWYKMSGSYEEYTREHDDKDDKKGTLSRNLALDIVIADCYRMITLDFCAHDDKRAKERLEKVRKLIKAFQRMETLIEKFIDKDF